MTTRPGFALLAVLVLALASCAAPPPRDSASFYYPSSQAGAASPGASGISARTATSATTPGSAPVPRGGYAPGSGPTAMPQGAQYMGQYRESGPFGSYSGSTVIQSSGGVQSYQTIGNMPVYPGMAVPGYAPDQPYYGPRTSQQPVFVPGTGGNPGYYMNPSTGARGGP